MSSRTSACPHESTPARFNQDLLALAGLFEDALNLSERYKEAVTERLNDKLTDHL